MNVQVSSQHPGLRCLHLDCGPRGQEPQQDQPGSASVGQQFHLLTPKLPLGLLSDKVLSLGRKCHSPAQRPGDRRETSAQMWEERPEV